MTNRNSYAEAGLDRYVIFVFGYDDLTPDEFHKHYDRTIRQFAKLGYSFVVSGRHGNCDRMTQDLLQTLNLPKHRVVIHDCVVPSDSTYTYRANSAWHVEYHSTLEESYAEMTMASDADLCWMRMSQDDGWLQYDDRFQKNYQCRDAKERLIQLKERKNWERVNIKEEIMNDGDCIWQAWSIVSDSPLDQADFKKVPIHPNLRHRLRTLSQDYRNARFRYYEACKELRRAVDEQEEFGD